MLLTYIRKHDQLTMKYPKHLSLNTLSIIIVCIYSYFGLYWSCSLLLKKGTMNICHNNCFPRVVPL